MILELLGIKKDFTFFFMSAMIVSLLFPHAVLPQEKGTVIDKPYGGRDIVSPGQAVIEYYNPDVNKAFAYQGDIFIQKEYAPGALRDNVFLVRAYDDNQTYEVSLNDIDRFEIRCQVRGNPGYCCSEMNITMRDGKVMRGELYSGSPFMADSTENEDLEAKPWTEFGLKTGRGIIKLRQQSGIRMKDHNLNGNLNCGFCNSRFGRIVSCTMEWSSEYKQKLKRLNDK